MSRFVGVSMLKIDLILIRYQKCVWYFGKIDLAQALFLRKLVRLELIKLSSINKVSLV